MGREGESRRRGEERVVERDREKGRGVRGWGGGGGREKVQEVGSVASFDACCHGDVIFLWGRNNEINKSVFISLALAPCWHGDAAWLFAPEDLFSPHPHPPQRLWLGAWLGEDGDKAHDHSRLSLTGSGVCKK